MLTDALATTGPTLSTESLSTNDTLNVGETWSYTATYEVSQADIDDGSEIENIALVSTTELPTPLADTAITSIAQTPILTLSKLADDTTKVFEGQLITYSYVTRNSGNVIISDVSLTDVHLGNNGLSPISLQSTDGIDDGLDAIVDTLYPGDSVVWVSTYIVSRQDILNGIDIINTATATGIPAGGILVDPTSVEILEIGSLLIAVNDSSLNNTVGTIASVNIITNDTLSDGSNIVNLTDITIDLNPTTTGIQDSLVVAGEGIYRYDTITGQVNFTPEVGFTIDPTPIVYTLIENQTGLDSNAIIVITYIEQPPVAVNDSSLNNMVGSIANVNIITNDTLSDGSNIVNLTNITIDLDTTTAGIQDTLVVAGEGTYRYDTLTGEVSFTPEVGFAGSPTPIPYTLTENATGLDSSANIVITYGGIDLSVTIEVDNESPVVGETVTFTVTVSNAGPSDALNVDLASYIPNGFGNIMDIDGGGIFSGDSIIWEISTLVNGADSVFTFTAVVLNPTGIEKEFEVTSQVTSALGIDVDSEPNNEDGDQSEDDEAVVCILPFFLSDFEVCEGDSIQIGSLIGYTSSWATPSGAIINLDSLIIGASSKTDSGQYILFITNGLGCTMVDTINVNVKSLPSVTVNTAASSCIGSTAQNDGVIVLTNFEATQSYQYSPGVFFSTGTATPALPTIIPVSGVIGTGIPDSALGQNFTVRVTGANGCFNDTTVLLEGANCSCPPPICIPIGIRKIRN